MNKICKSFISVLSHGNLEKTYSSAAVLGRHLSFRSDLSLDKLYPNSRLQLYTPPPPSNKDDKFSGFIPINKLEITYSRSSGPGGQHVNTVNTKVDVRFKLAEADWIPEKTRQKLLNSLQNKITKEGYYVVKSDLTRSQQMNLADALEKLRALIREYEIEAPPPSEETLEKLRKRQEKAARERLFQKRQRSQTKADRQGPSIADL
ncbi:large ribosomal subunit protein mL62-like [Musca domestica]|uniref:Large ribosomal subunit protein mL62 n=1 Tax=Musca domestica TaxID=7370 RepID=T1PJ94_MUSDO|nr:large ribosomal subunit protein mL62 [Musca domestica]XP_058980596.1 large ribosomal subunit protein mL62-like [Musca domestica]